MLSSVILESMGGNFVLYLKQALEIRFTNIFRLLKIEYVPLVNNLEKWHKLTGIDKGTVKVLRPIENFEFPKQI